MRGWKKTERRLQVSYDAETEIWRGRSGDLPEIDISGKDYVDVRNRTV